MSSFKSMLLFPLLSFWSLILFEEFRVATASIPSYLPVDFGKHFNLNAYQPTVGWARSGTGTYIWAYPGNQSVIGPLDMYMHNDIPHKRLLIFFGPDNGYQLTFSNMTYLIYEYPIQPTTDCYYTGYNYDDYVINLGETTKTANVILLAPWWSLAGSYHALTRDPSTCGGFASVTTYLDPSEKYLGMDFSSIYTAPFGSIYTKTLTNYRYSFTQDIPLNTSESFWALPSICWHGSPNLKPLCNTTFPGDSGWFPLDEYDPTGNYHNYVNPPSP